MSFFELPHTVVLWPYAGTSPSGEPLLGDPVELNARVELRRQVTVNTKGEQFAIDGTVWLEQEVLEDSILWKGKLEDWDPTIDQPLLRVAYYNEIPDLMDNEIERTVGVTRFRGRLPTTTATP